MKLVSVSASGHRGEYASLLAAELEPLGVHVEVTSHVDLLARDTVFFGVIEDHPAQFAMVAALRSLLRKRTAGFLFRPGQCFTPHSLRHWVKRSVFRVLSRLPNTSVLTVLPHDVDRRFNRVSSGWVFDPQLWDLPTLHPDRTPTCVLADTVLATAAGRRTLIALGRQDRDKGFDFLAQVVASPEFPHDRYLVVAAGVVAERSRTAADAFVASGGMLVDRHLTNEELLALYRAATLIWSCYGADYDQASGIFGRAVQLGVPAVVRAGSYLVKLAGLIEHPVVEVEIDPSAAARAIASADAVRPAGDAQERVAWMRRVSLEALAGAVSAT